MAEDTDQLRQQIHERRSSIAGTVDQIENRVSPSRIAARRSSRIRRRVTDLADSIFGNDDPDYVSSQPYAPYSASDDPSRIDQLQDAAPSTEDVRRQARGNPMAAGLISFGAGLLLGSILPDSHRERHMAQRAHPRLRTAVSEAAASGQTVASELQAAAQSATDDLKSSATDHGQELKSEATSAATDVKDSATS